MQIIGGDIIKTSSIEKSIVGVVTILIIVLAVLIPISDGLLNNVKETGNNPTGDYIISLSSEPVSIKINSTSGGLIINDVEQNQDYIMNHEKIWVNGACAWVYYNESAEKYYLQGISNINTTTRILNEIIFDGTTATFTYSGGSDIYPTDFILYPDTNGKYTQVQINSEELKEMKFNNKNPIYFGYLGGGYALGKYVENEFTQLEGTTLAVNTLTLTADPVKLPDNSEQFQISPIISYENDTTSTYYDVYLPIEYNYFTSGNSIVNTLISITPVLILIGAIVMFIVPIIRNKH